MAIMAQKYPKIPFRNAGKPFVEGLHPREELWYNRADAGLAASKLKDRRFNDAKANRWRYRGYWRREG